MKYPKSFLETFTRSNATTDDYKAIRAMVIQSVTIEQVLTHYGSIAQFEKLFDTLRGPCPICSTQKTFHVYKSAKRWYCQGSCRQGGDVISLVCLKERKRFIGAVRLLTEWFNLGSEAASRPQDPKMKQRRQMLVAAARKFRFPPVEKAS